MTFTTSSSRMLVIVLANGLWEPPTELYTAYRLA
jgi:hypothetical protein